MKYVCQTLFDITATGVTGHCRPTRMPFTDHARQLIQDQDAWHRSRNQQRNWETLTQIIGLRTQIFDLQQPVRDRGGTTWMFEFETESSGVFGPEADPTQILRSDSEGVPMILGLGNRSDLSSVIINQGPKQNIWFAVVP
jgi:hypothetical protein